MRAIGMFFFNPYDMFKLEGFKFIDVIDKIQVKIKSPSDQL